MSKPTSVRNVADYRAVHDKNVVVPAKIKKALEDMLNEGPENWAYESEFVRRAGVSQTDMGTFRDQFADHIVETSGHNPKKVWFAAAKVARRIRGE